MFLQVQELHTKKVIYGLAYTEILHTSQGGFGLVGYALPSLHGVFLNRTFNMEARIVVYLAYRQRNGMIIHAWHVLVTFVKSMVSTTLKIRKRFKN